MPPQVAAARLPLPLHATLDPSVLRRLPASDAPGPRRNVEPQDVPDCGPNILIGRHETVAAAVLAALNRATAGEALTLLTLPEVAAHLTDTRQATLVGQAALHVPSGTEVALADADGALPEPVLAALRLRSVERSADPDYLRRILCSDAGDHTFAAAVGNRALPDDEAAVHLTERLQEADGARRQRLACTVLSGRPDLPLPSAMCAAVLHRPSADTAALAVKVTLARRQAGLADTERTLWPDGLSADQLAARAGMLLAGLTGYTAPDPDLVAAAAVRLSGHRDTYWLAVEPVAVALRADLLTNGPYGCRLRFEDALRRFSAHLARLPGRLSDTLAGLVAGPLADVCAADPAASDTAGALLPKVRHAAPYRGPHPIPWAPFRYAAAAAQVAAENGGPDMRVRLAGRWGVACPSDAADASAAGRAAWLQHAGYSNWVAGGMVPPLPTVLPDRASSEALRLPASATLRSADLLCRLGAGAAPQLQRLSVADGQPPIDGAAVRVVAEAMGGVGSAMPLRLLLSVAANAHQPTLMLRALKAVS